MFVGMPFYDSVSSTPPDDGCLDDEDDVAGVDVFSAVRAGNCSTPAKRARWSNGESLVSQIFSEEAALASSTPAVAAHSKGQSVQQNEVESFGDSEGSQKSIASLSEDSVTDESAPRLSAARERQWCIALIDRNNTIVDVSPDCVNVTNSQDASLFLMENLQDGLAMERAKQRNGQPYPKITSFARSSRGGSWVEISFACPDRGPAQPAQPADGCELKLRSNRRWDRFVSESNFAVKFRQAALQSADLSAVSVLCCDFTKKATPRRERTDRVRLSGDATGKRMRSCRSSLGSRFDAVSHDNDQLDVGDIQPDNTAPEAYKLPFEKKLGSYYVSFDQMEPTPPALLIRDIKPAGVELQIKHYVDFGGDSPDQPWPVVVANVEVLNQCLQQQAIDGFQSSDEHQKLTGDTVKKLKFYTVGANHNRKALDEILTKKLLPDNSLCFQKIQVHIWHGLSETELLMIAMRDNSNRRVENTWWDNALLFRRLLIAFLGISEDAPIPPEISGVRSFINRHYGKMSDTVLTRYLKLVRIPHANWRLVKILAQQSLRVDGNSYMAKEDLPRFISYLSLENKEALTFALLDMAVKGNLDLKNACERIIEVIRKREIVTMLRSKAPDACSGLTYDSILTEFKVGTDDLRAWDLLSSEKMAKCAANVTSLVDKKIKEHSDVHAVVEHSVVLLCGDLIISPLAITQAATTVNLINVGRELNRSLKEFRNEVTGIFHSNPDLAEALVAAQQKLGQKKPPTRSANARTTQRCADVQVNQ